MRELIKNLWNKKLFRVVTIVVGIPVTIFMLIIVCAFCKAFYDVVLTDNYEEYMKTPEYKLEQQQKAEKEEAERKAEEAKEKAEQEKEAAENKAKAEAKARKEAEEKAEAERKAKEEEAKKKAEAERKAKAIAVKNEEKNNTVKKIARDLVIGHMENEGIDGLALQDVNNCMVWIEVNMENDERFPELPANDIRMIAAQEMLDIAQWNDGTTAEDIIYMRDFMKKNRLANTDHYELMANADMTREEIVEIEKERFGEILQQIKLDLFGIQAGDYEFTIWDFDINVTSIKVTVEARQTGRQLYEIYVDFETGEYSVHDAEQTTGEKIKNLFN